MHIVLNNQIGFTTSNPLDARSTLYCTEVAKMVQAPILHVNGDDPDAVMACMEIASDFRMAFKKDAMGFGDVKLMGAIGAFFGWQGVLFTLIVSSFVGAISGITMVVAGGREMQSRIPFGPYISLAALLWMLWGHGWWNAYINMMTPDLAPGPYVP